MTDQQCNRIVGAINFLAVICFLAVIALVVGFSEGVKAIQNLKPTMQITQNPTTVKVIDGPRPTGLLPGVDMEEK